MGYISFNETWDTGVNWIRKAPKHWRIKRLKFSTKLINHKMPAEESALPYIGLEHIESWTGKRITGEIANSEGIASRFSVGDLLFGKLRPYLAKVHLAYEDGLVSSEAFVIRNSTDVLPEFLKYYTLSPDFIEIVDSSTFGSKMPRANWEFVGNLPLLLPPLSEQQTIAAFLDYKTAKIDALIAKKKALLDKLAEKRTALISHAVTKGLDPKVPMRDSGIDWLGNIPAHWEVKRVKNIATYNDEALSDKTDLDFEFEYVDISSVSLFNGIERTETLNFESSPSRARRRVKHGDVVVSTVRTYLKAIAQVNTPPENMIVSTGFAVIRPMKQVCSGYIGYLLQSNGFVGDVVARSVGVSYPAINASELARIPVVEPPFQEQQAIVDFLNENTAKIDDQKGKIEAIITRLQEYRSALITNAVTGKIDVRNFHLPEAEELVTHEE